MTKDVIELAREAGFFLYDLTETHGIKTVESDAADQWAQLAHFAALVAAQVKERCAQLCESEWSNIAEKMYGAQLAAAIRALNTEGDVDDRP